MSKISLYKTGVQDGTLYLFFKEAKSISAGTPYIVKWMVDGYNQDGPDDPAYDYQDPVFANVTIDKTLSPVSSNDGKLTFQPTYAPIVWRSQDRSILYLGGNSTLYYPNADMTIGAFRAYFQLNGITAGTLATGDIKSIVLNFSDEETGITATNLTNQTNMADAWYTIDGRKLDKKPAQRGLYINKGNKIAIK